MTIDVLLSRHAEIYSGHAPLDWLILPRHARYDRKRQAYEFDLPPRARLRLCDGVKTYQILVSGDEQALSFRAARLRGQLTCLEI